MRHFDTRDRSGNNLGSQKGLTSVLKFPLFHYEQCVYFRLLAFIFRRSLPTRLFLPPIFLPPFRPPPFLWYSETSFALLFVLALLPFFLPPKPNLLSLKFLLLLSLKFFLKLSGLLQKEMQNMYYRWLGMISSREGQYYCQYQYTRPWTLGSDCSLSQDLQIVCKSSLSSSFPVCHASEWPKYF